METQQNRSDSSFRERLRFAIWLSAYTVGTDSGKDLALAIGKRPDQFSKWLKGTKPEFATVRLIAERVGVSALWLDTPAASGAVEHPWFAGWIEAQRAFQVQQAQPAKRARKGGGYVVRVGKGK